MVLPASCFLHDSLIGTSANHFTSISSTYGSIVMSLAPFHSKHSLWMSSFTPISFVVNCSQDSVKRCRIYIPSPTKISFGIQVDVLRFHIVFCVIGIIDIATSSLWAWFLHVVLLNSFAKRKRVDRLTLPPATTNKLPTNQHVALWPSWSQWQLTLLKMPQHPCSGPKHYLVTTQYLPITQHAVKYALKWQSSNAHYGPHANIKLVCSSLKYTGRFTSPFLPRNLSTLNSLATRLC